MYGPERVQTIEEYESARPRSRPLRPGRLSKGTVHAASRVNMPLPGWLRGSTRAEINDEAIAFAGPPGTRFASKAANSVDSSKPRRTYSRPCVPTVASQLAQPVASGSRIKYVLYRSRT